MIFGNGNWSLLDQATFLYLIFSPTGENTHHPHRDTMAHNSRSSQHSRSPDTRIFGTATFSSISPSYQDDEYDDEGSTYTGTLLAFAAFCC